MIRAEFFSELEQILELDPGSVRGGEELASLGGWDSMAILTFIAFVDDQLGVTLSPEAIGKCTKASDLADLLGDRLQ